MARWIIIALLLFPNIALGGVYVSGGVDPVEIGRRIAVSSPGVITLASGSVTRANMKLSAADGTAFVDFSTANVLTNYVPYKGKLTIIDSAGKKLVGYIKAAGTGETYGSELISGWDNAPSPYSYDTLITDGLDITTAQKTTAASARVYSAVSTALGDLLRISLTTVRSGGWITAFYAKAGSTNYTVGYNNFSNAYHVLPVAYDAFYLGTSGINTWSMTGFSLRKVLTPSTTGVTITSTADGTTYNWASQETGFNYNDTSGYTYAITTR